MGEPRIIAIELDEGSIIRRSEDIEQERRVALYDLIEGNHFALADHEGPYRVRLAVEDGRLVLDVSDQYAQPLENVRIGLARFRRPIRDYFHICESYFRAVRAGDPRGIETIDMARRGIHNEAAEMLKDCLAPQVEVDFDTARRLFTLICVLHIKAGTTVVEQPAIGG